MCTFVEKVVCSKTYVRGGVLKKDVRHYGEGRDGNPHDDIIKKFFSNYKCEMDFLGRTKFTLVSL